MLQCKSDEVKNKRGNVDWLNILAPKSIFCDRQVLTVVLSRHSCWEGKVFLYFLPWAGQNSSAVAANC